MQKKNKERHGGKGGKVIPASVRSELEKHGNMFVPTDEQRNSVRLCVGFGIPQEKIRLLVINPNTGKPISIELLHEAFAQEIEVGTVAMEEFASKMLKTKIGEGNVTAIIWFMKNRMGWRDGVDYMVEHNDHLTLTLEGDELVRRLEERGLPTSIFNARIPVLEHIPREENNGDEAAGGANGSAEGSNGSMAPRRE